MMGRVVLWNKERVFRTKSEAMTELMLSQKEWNKALLEGKWKMVFPVYRIQMKDGTVEIGRESGGKYYDFWWGNEKRSKDIVKVEDVTELLAQVL